MPAPSSTLPTANLVPVSVVIFTRNEEKNIGACLESLAGWAGEIFVVDSHSTDATCEIAKRFAAHLYQHAFEGHAQQRNWGLENLPFRFNWILALDADHRLTPELREEIRMLLNDPEPHIAGYFIKRRQIFRGQWIRHGGYYPKYLLKLFQKGKARLDDVEFDYRFYVAERTARLKYDLLEDNRNEEDIGFWVEKHNRFATAQAREEIERMVTRRQWFLKPTFWGNPDQRVLWLKGYWYRLPLYVRPFVYFFYRYFLRLGFLDGKEGLTFHLFQGLWYRLLVDVKIEELLREKGFRKLPLGGVAPSTAPRQPTP